MGEKQKGGENHPNLRKRPPNPSPVLLQYSSLSCKVKSLLCPSFRKHLHFPCIYKLKRFTWSNSACLCVGCSRPSTATCHQHPCPAGWPRSDTNGHGCRNRPPSTFVMELQVRGGIFNVLGGYTGREHPLPHHQQLTVTAMGVTKLGTFHL